MRVLFVRPHVKPFVPSVNVLLFFLTTAAAAVYCMCDSGAMFFSVVATPLRTQLLRWIKSFGQKQTGTKTKTKKKEV